MASRENGYERSMVETEIRNSTISLPQGTFRGEERLPEGTFRGTSADGSNLVSVGEA